MFARPLAQVGLGVVAGCVLTVILGDVEEATPRTLAGALVYSVLMLGVCLLACVVPARRALGVQPTVAMRVD